MTVSTADVFISYKAEDRARLQPLVAALEAEGFTVWWDAHIGGGANWRQDIQDHLDAARCVIVAWSRRSIGPEGEFVRDEAMRAKRLHTYLPIRIDDVSPPLGFGEVQALSLKNWKGDRSDPRLVAVVDAIRERLTGEHVEHHIGDHRQPWISRRAAVAGGIGIGAIAVAGTAGWLLLKPGSAEAKRIAVLPFANLSGAEDQAYFADGIAEELRAALSRIGMEVIGRTSSESVKGMDAATVAAKLNVANILTGSVRRSPEVIRVNAQLVSGKDGVERWAQTYDRAPGDAIKIQTDIAASVAQALSIALGQAGRAALTLGGTGDSVAQDLILQSRQLRRSADVADTAPRRLALAEAAIVRDPRYAEAYVEKVDGLLALSDYARTSAEAAKLVARADAAAKRAVALEPRLGSAHTALAELAIGRIDFASALRETEQALALSPANLDVLASASRKLARFGSAEEALRVVDRGIALDPLNGRLYRNKCEVFNFLRRYRLAIEAGRRALELAPDIRVTHLYVGDAFLLLGQAGQAKAEYEASSAHHPFRLARLALLAARTGDRAGAERLMAQLRRRTGTNYSFHYGQIYAQLGDHDRAFAEFDNAIEAKDPGLDNLRAHPFLDPIRGDPRYAALVRKLFP